MIVQGPCVSFALDCLNGVHQPGDDYKIALYGSGADIDPDTAAYTSAGEASGVGYVAGGQSLAGRASSLDGIDAVMTFDDAIWAASTITARGALVYNATRANKAVGVLNFGQDIISTNGPFTVGISPDGLVRISV